MITPLEDFLNLDIGTSWTKAFLVSAGQESSVKTTLKLPTSAEDLSFSTNLLIGKIVSKSKTPKIILTSTYNEAADLTKIFKASFVDKETVRNELFDWFSLQNFENPLILDGGASNYLRNFRISETDLENIIGNKSLRLETIPEDRNQLEIEEAILRSSFSIVHELHNPAKFNTLIITGGILSWSTETTRSALLLLDLMAAGKVVQVYRDDAAFLSSYGALIAQKKNFKSQDLKTLKNMGCLVSLGGSGKVSLDYGLSEIQEVTISENEIALIPATSSQKVELSIQGSEKIKFRVSGGEWGIILDGRIKPLALEFGQEKSRQAVLSWQQALGKVQLLEI